jgi:hypothetical protein
VKRRPVPEEYWGCSRQCFDQGSHTKVWGQCEKAGAPPCEHPATDIVWDPQKVAVACRGCGVEVTLLELAQAARVGLSLGCLCSGDECSGHCGGDRATAWTLDPAKILAYVTADREGMAASKSMMLSFLQTEWEELERLAEETHRTPEQTARAAVLRVLRQAKSWRD